MDGELTLRSLAIQSRRQKRNSESKIVGPISSTSTAVCSSSPTFKLPDGWAVEQRWRRDGSRCDKYYYELGSGRQFRSILSVQQYLDGKTNVAPKRSGYRKNVWIRRSWTFKRKQDKPDLLLQMQITRRVCKSGSHFGLPDGWVVEEQQRNNIKYARIIDRCYIEPGTGKRFRSLISAQRYLRGDLSYLTDGKVYAATAKEGNHNMQIVPHNFNSCGNFTLPESWVVEEKPRSNVNYAGTVDKYYIEPGTGKRFRSLKSVESYLSEGKSGAPKALTPGNQFYLTDGKEYKTSTELLECSNSSKSHMSSDKVEISIIDLCNPPAKIKWVLNPGGNMWRSFVEDTPVPESVTHKWGETFIRCLNKRY